MATTYTSVPQAALKDRIERIVGDATLPTFQPQMKLMRWDNEVNFSMRLVNTELTPTITQDPTGKIHWLGQNTEAHFYDVPPSDTVPGGGSEMEVVLKSKPLTNVILFSIQSKGLDFFKQPPLTAAEIARGADRPVNVIDSYALYTSAKKGNTEGGKLYRSGKFGHIYRPRMVDANGQQTWGTLNIANGFLSVTIPQPFLDSATYPIRHATGSTLGHTTIGATATASTNGFIYAFGRFQMPSAGTLSKLTAYTKDGDSGATKLKVGMYNDSSSTPGSAVARDNTGAMTADGSPGWADSAALSGSLVSGNYYWFACLTAQGAVSTAYFYYDSGSDLFREYNTSGQASLIDPFGTSTANSALNTSIYATYSAASADPPFPPNTGIPQGYLPQIVSQ